VHQRAFGELHIAFGLRNERTVLRDLRQEGCLKARFPRPTGWTEAITLNSGGGVAGGDNLNTRLDVQAGASASFAAQAAERFYRALPNDPPAHVRTAIAVAEDAHAEWLPQESILFDQCALDRELTVDVAENGWFLGVESLLFGRAAMGESVHTARLHDTIRIRRNGALLLHDAIRLPGEVGKRLRTPATANGARGLATLVHVAPDAEHRLDAVRAAWHGIPAETGASAWNGMLVGRILAQDGVCLRAALVAGLQSLRDGRPLPRVWTC
jgi:urease accessory protein